MNLLYALHGYLRGTGVDCAICGGGAIDLFAGRKTRPHKDVDVSADWADRDRIIRFLLADGWDVYEPCGTEWLHRIRDTGEQMRVKSNIWCVREGNPRYAFTEKEKDMYAVDFDDSEQMDLDFIEFLFNRRKDGHFLYARNPAISRAWEDAVLTFDGIPYLAPEIVLLYKSTASGNPEYQRDFDTALPLMAREQRAWLKSALCTAYPEGHRWAERV